MSDKLVNVGHLRMEAERSADMASKVAAAAAGAIEELSEQIDALNQDIDSKMTGCGVSPFTKTFEAASWASGQIVIPASEHKLKLEDSCVLSKIYMYKNDEYADDVLAVMDTQVSVDEDKNVVLSYSGPGYAGKAVLLG